MWIKLLKFQDSAWHFLLTHRPSNHCCLDVRSCICSECRVWRYAVVQEVVICTVTFCLPGNMNDFYLHGNETFYLTRCWRKRCNNFNSWVLHFKTHSMNLGKNIASIPNFMRVDHGAEKGTKYYWKKIIRAPTCIHWNIKLHSTKQNYCVVLSGAVSHEGRSQTDWQAAVQRWTWQEFHLA